MRISAYYWQEYLHDTKFHGFVDTLTAMKIRTMKIYMQSLMSPTAYGNDGGCGLTGAMVQNLNHKKIA